MKLTLKDQMKAAAAALLAAAIETNDAQAGDSTACSAGRVIASGIASWYGPGFNGRPTANGETYDQNKFTAAHLRLAFSSIVRVENMENGKAVKLRVNDRGPITGAGYWMYRGLPRRRWALSMTAQRRCAYGCAIPNQSGISRAIIADDRALPDFGSLFTCG